MSKNNVGKFLEFLIYMIVEKSRNRRSSLSLKFQPTDELHNFVLQLKTKIEEEERDVCMSAMSASIVANVAATQKQESASNQTYAAAMMNRKSTYVCNYCNLEDHTSSRCYTRIKDRRRELRKSQEAEGWSTEAEASRWLQPRYNGTVPLKKPTKTWHAPAPNKTNSHSAHGTPGDQRLFCILHNSASHSTEECFTVITLRKKRLDIQPNNNKGPGYNKPSGEAMRPIHYKPS